jgi:hypothetical protein
MRLALASAIVVLWLPAASLAAPVDPFDEMLGSVEREDDYTAILNLLDTALRQPVNLLTAGRREIAGLPWMSPWLADSIVALRRRGALDDVEDLARIEGVTGRRVALIRPFVVVVPPRRKVSPWEGLFRTRLVASPASSRFENQKTYFRMEAAYDGHRAGGVIEKDRGEVRLNDFQAYFVEAGWGWGRVTGGDFTLTSGYGLVFSNPYGYSPSTVDPWRFSQGDFGMKPYVSVNENFALRGVGLAVRHRRLAACLALSRSKFDATLDEDGRVTGVATSGYHTTAGEIEGTDALREDLAGLAARYRAGPVGAGLTLSYTRFDREFAPGRLGTLSRSGNLLAALDLVWQSGEHALFAEAAAAAGGQAILGGLAVDRSGVELLFLGRSYTTGLVSLHASPFAFYSGYATGERGVMARIAYRPASKMVFSVGSDLHDKAPAGSGLSRPSGSETFVDGEVGFGRFTVAAALKLLLTRNPPSAQGDPVQDRTRLRSRLDIRYDPAGARWIRLRYEHLDFREDQGTARERLSSDLVRLDGGFAAGRVLLFRVGFYVFSVPGYDARLYQYEPGLPYYPSLQMLKSHGSRWYSVLSSDRPLPGKLAVKIAQVVYDNDSDRFETLIYYNVTF